MNRLRMRMAREAERVAAQGAGPFRPRPKRSDPAFVPRRVPKVHLNGPRPSNVTKCGIVAVHITARREQATCRNCLNGDPQARQKWWKRYYARHRERILAQRKEYRNRPEVWARRQQWLKDNRMRLADYDIEVTFPRRKARRAARRRERERAMAKGAA